MSGQLVTVATFWNIAEAEVTRVYLESEGIHAYLADDHVVNSLWQMSNAIGGVKVQVSDADAAQAIALLSAADTLKSTANQTLTEPSDAHADEVGEDNALENSSQADEEDFYGDIEESDLNPRESNADKAFRGAVLGMVCIPLQPFVFWVLLKTFLSDEPLRPGTRWKLWCAALINIPFMIVIGWFVIVMVRKS